MWEVQPDQLYWVFSPPLPREMGHIHLLFAVSLPKAVWSKHVWHQVPLESGFNVLLASEDQWLATRKRVPGALTPSQCGLTGQPRAAESLKLALFKTSLFITWLCWATQNKVGSMRQGSECQKEMVGQRERKEATGARWPLTIFISRNIRFIPKYPRARLVILASGSENRSFVVTPSSLAATNT